MQNSQIVPILTKVGYYCKICIIRLNKLVEKSLSMSNKFFQGARVRDTYSRKIGYLSGKTRPFGNGLRWEVNFNDLESEYIRENDLEIIADIADIADIDDMVSLFKQCRFNGVLDLRRLIQQLRLSGSLNFIL